MERREGHLAGAGAVWPEPEGLDLPAKTKAGLRPEHLSLRGPGVEMAAKVLQIEPLGAETHVLFDAAGTMLRAKVPGFDAPARGAEVPVFARAEAVLWFDAATGKRVRGKVKGAR